MDFKISIHAPRTGSDRAASRSAFSSSNFNPRSPHGERPIDVKAGMRIFRFQSTLPARGATTYLRLRWNRLRYFNPRSPHGERHNTLWDTIGIWSISIHAPRTGSDQLFLFRQILLKISIHAPRTGSDTNVIGSAASGAFQSTLPARGATATIYNFDPSIFDFNPRSPHGERRNRKPVLSLSH